MYVKDSAKRASKSSASAGNSARQLPVAGGQLAPKALVDGTGCPVDYAPMALWITVLHTCRLRSRCSLRISGFAPMALVEGDEV